ncbi:hypothetical protein HRI_002353800 [Hibiscus trionum]|uniref:Uncharacterized protein n=1 Tax=Hibiscus trionum TaxID=183268 RepID=A0A9W7I3F5_HIBTR|nr:hypothetical protein HRI_002353800 [Hibiscus trionum]
MGCGVSRFDNAEGGEDRQCRQPRLMHRNNDLAVVRPKPLPADGEGEDDSRGKEKSEGKGRDYNKEECLEDNGSYIPHSLSFRVYCNSSLDDNTQGDSNADSMTDKQKGDPESSKGSSTRLGWRAKIGKGLKSILRA